ncbi:MAG: PilZ domain-containing protein [Spirochaetales bacterium]|nr:PilZ domain-containing protein [Spirochaetales bacterium]
MKIDSVFMDKMNTVNNVVSLRFCFTEDEKGKQVSFFVPGKIAGYSQYKGAKQNNLYLLNFDFSKRPADDLIGTLGKLLEVNIASQKRKEVRLDVDQVLLEDLQIQAKSVKLEVEGVPRMGILRDISFGGARIIISGIAKYLVEKNIVLYLQTDLEVRHIKLPGVIKRWDKVEGRKDLAIIAVQFNENIMPMCLKSKLNDAMEKRGL